MGLGLLGLRGGYPRIPKWGILRRPEGQTDPVLSPKLKEMQRNWALLLGPSFGGRRGVRLGSSGFHFRENKDPVLPLGAQKGGDPGPPFLGFWEPSSPAG